LYFNNCFYQAYHVEDGSIRWDDEKKVVWILANQR
jgi:hypothetical protein